MVDYLQIRSSTSHLLSLHSAQKASHNNNNNNKPIYKAPQGRNFRDTVDIGCNHISFNVRNLRRQIWARCADISHLSKRMQH